jgi:hypothetical protein
MRETLIGKTITDARSSVVTALASGRSDSGELDGEIDAVTAGAAAGRRRRRRRRRGDSDHCGVCDA